MTNDPGSSRSKESPFSNPTIVVALIGGLCTLVAAIITVVPQLLPLVNGPTETPVPILTSTVFVPSTSESTLSPTVVLPTETGTLIPPTPTETVTPAPTPVDPGFSCLDRWQVISSNPALAETTGQGNCARASVPALGISASSAGISFAVNNFREQGTFGIVTSLPANATVTLQVEFLVLSQGEFWVALSNTPNPENNMTIFALEPSNGELRIYNDQTSSFSDRYNYRNLLTNTSLSPNVLPYIYKITFVINGNRVKPRIHFTDLPAQSVNLPNYLFLGYTNKSAQGSVTMQIDVTSLVVEVK